MTNSSESDVIHQENVYPTGFLQLFTSTHVESSPEALSVLLHTCMLNVGFIPVDIEEQYVYKCMPKNWKAKGAWKFQYCHRTCPDIVCWMTCVPLYSYLAVHGVVEGFPCDNAYIKLKVPSYVNDEGSISNVENLFINCRKLEKKFKDEFCYPLLASLQESAGCEPSFGLSVTVDEIKLYILKLLPVQSVVGLSCVNKDFNRLVNSNSLWKHLLQRDFGLVDCSTEDNCKEIYKREYFKKKQKARRLFHVYDPLFYPPYLPIAPSSYIDVRRDLDPALQQAFPHLRDRFRPNWIFPPYDFPGRFM